MGPDRGETYYIECSCPAYVAPAETPTWEDAAVETQKTLNLALRRITELEHLLASQDARIRELERENEALTTLTAALARERPT